MFTKFTKFTAQVSVEGEYPSYAQIFKPMSLLEHALRLSLLSESPEDVANVVTTTTALMLHSLGCKRRQIGDQVRLSDDDKDGYNGLYQISADRGEPTECMRCGNPECAEWPTLDELSSEGVPTGEYAYHVSECQMSDR